MSCTVPEPNRCLPKNPDPHSSASPLRSSPTPRVLLKTTRWSLACNVFPYPTIPLLLRRLAVQRNLFPQSLAVWTYLLTRMWTMSSSSLPGTTVAVWYPNLVRNLPTFGMVCTVGGVSGTVGKSIMLILKDQYHMKRSKSSSQRKSTKMSLRRAFFHSKKNRNNTISICVKRHASGSRSMPSASSDAGIQAPQDPTTNPPPFGSPVITRTLKTGTNRKSLLGFPFPRDPPRPVTIAAGQQRSQLGRVAMMTDLPNYPLENLCPAVCPGRRAPRASPFTSTESCRPLRALLQTPNT